MNSHGLDQTKVYMDFKGFDQLRLQAKNNAPEALEKVAKKFESVFLQMVMKSMRDANSLFKEDNLLQSDSIDFYQEMFDKQLAMNLSDGEGLGLANVLVRQLSQNQPQAVSDARQAQENQPLSTIKTTQAPVANMPDKPQPLFDTPLDFVKSLWSDAVETAKKMNVDPKMLIAQAALETGWGKSIIQAKNGDSSFNLFNIKADRSWDKPQVSVNTLEYEQGIAVKKVEPFRQYTNFSESFADYMSFLNRYSRYSEALANSDDPKAYIEGLQKAGYATDPSYADKVYSIYQGQTLNDAIEQLEVK